MEKHIITLVPLGPDSEALMTVAARDALLRAKRLVLRTARHGAAGWLARQGVPFETLDALYEQSEDFDALCAASAEALAGMARESGALTYACADPAGDATVAALLRALPQDCAVDAAGGGSLAENAALAALTLGMGTENLRTLAAQSLSSLRPSADCPQAIVEIDNRLLASDVKLWLTDLFDDETPVCFLENAAEPGARGRLIPLCELDRQPRYDHRTALFVPAVSVYERRRANYEDFAQVIARLRAPGGCPWDREQTHRSLRRYMIEEACEAAEAMDGDDPMKIADELGDVLLQVVLCSAIGAEHRDFTDRDVTSLVTRKMISRHEHVFGRVKAEDAQAVVPVWENAKRKERGAQTPLERALDVPGTLPALMRAQKVVRRLTAEQPGEELAALAADGAKSALSRLRAGEGDREALLGELLEAVCALAHALDLDAETALRSATRERLDRMAREEKKTT